MTKQKSKAKRICVCKQKHFLIYKLYVKELVFLYYATVALSVEDFVLSFFNITFSSLSEVVVFSTGFTSDSLYFEFVITSPTTVRIVSYFTRVQYENTRDIRS